MTGTSFRNRSEQFTTSSRTERPLRGRRFRVGSSLLALLLSLPMLAFADPTPHSRWAWTPLGSEIGSRGFSLLDVNGDGRAELFAAPSQSYWYELQRQGRFHQTWSSVLDEDELVTLESIQSAAGPRIVLLYEHRLEMLHASSKSVLLTVPLPQSSWTDLALGDLDANGILDAVVCDADTLYRFELATGTLTAVRPGFGCTDVAIGRIDADPQLEIAIAGNPTGGYVLDGISLDVEWGDLEGFGQYLSVGDLDADGRDEILASSDFENVARGLDPETNSELWRSAAGYYSVRLLAADIDPAPGAEAIVVSSYSGISVFVGATGELIRSINDAAGATSNLAAADSDGDGDLELLWGGYGSCCSGSSVWALEGGSNVVVKLADDTTALVGGFAVGELSGGPTKEVALATPGVGYSSYPDQMVILDMVLGREQRRSAFEDPNLNNSISALAAAQLDGDPQLEICAGPSGGYDRLSCVDGLDFAEEWNAGVFASVWDLEIAELDGDPAPEILAGTTGPAIEAREGDLGWLKWRTGDIDTSLDQFSQLLALDVDGDHLDEVLGQLTDYYYPGDLALFSGATGEVVAGPWSVDARAIARPSLAPGAPHKVYVALDDATIRGFNPLTGVATAPLAYLPAGALALAVIDLDVDGTLDFIVVNEERKLQVVDGATESVVWTGPILSWSSYYSERFFLQAGDFDDNGLPDFLASSAYGIFFFEGPFTVLFSDAFESGSWAAWSGVTP